MTLGYYFSPSRLANIKKIGHTACWRGYREIGSPVDCCQAGDPVGPVAPHPGNLLIYVPDITIFLVQHKILTAALLVAA